MDGREHRPVTRSAGKRCEFHCSVHPLPEPPRGSAASRFALTYDQVAEQLENLPQLFLEPDGSFVWVGKDHGHGPLWRLDGQLTDGGPALELLELKGYCGREQLDAVLTMLGWPQHAVRFHLPQEGVFLDESEFRHRFITEGV